ncbi:MAG: response regulator [Magnetococcales bacterium]|nr:response regulator [Magnetococcales bacterium]
MNQEMLLAVLEEVGLTARVAENGRIGVEMARQFRPDIILMDLHMPVMDGLSATRELRKHPETADIPVIGLSADAFLEREREAREAGIDTFLTKPVDLSRLIPLLAEHLSHQQGQGGSAASAVQRPPLPEELAQRVRAGLAEIARLPVYESGQIVTMCDALTAWCAPHDTPFAAVLGQIRDAVFSRNSRRIPEIIRATEGW